MGQLTSSYRHNLGNLTRFGGRDTKAQFWPWAITVSLVAYGSAMMTMGTAMLDAFLGTMRAGKDGNLAQAVADLGWLWMPLALIATTAVALLAASVTRRLHDIGWRGGWGLLPVPFLGVGIAHTRNGFRHAAAASGAEPPLSAFVSPFLFYLTLIALIIVLARRGQAEGNRFGPPAPTSR